YARSRRSAISACLPCALAMCRSRCASRVLPLRRSAIRKVSPYLAARCSISRCASRACSSVIPYLLASNSTVAVFAPGGADGSSSKEREVTSTSPRCGNCSSARSKCRLPREHHGHTTSNQISPAFHHANPLPSRGLPGQKPSAAGDSVERGLAVPGPLELEEAVRFGHQYQTIPQPPGVLAFGGRCDDRAEQSLALDPDDWGAHIEPDVVE